MADVTPKALWHKKPRRGIPANGRYPTPGQFLSSGRDPVNDSVQALACPDLFSLLLVSSRGAYQGEMLSRT